MILVFRIELIFSNPNSSSTPSPIPFSAELLRQATKGKNSANSTVSTKSIDDRIESARSKKNTSLPKRSFLKMHLIKDFLT